MENRKRDNKLTYDWDINAFKKFSSEVRLLLVIALYEEYVLTSYNINNHT